MGASVGCCEGSVGTLVYLRSVHKVLMKTVVSIISDVGHLLTQYLQRLKYLLKIKVFSKFFVLNVCASLCVCV